MSNTVISIREISEIKTLHAEITDSAQSSLEKAVRVGELLTKARAEIQNGDWSDWVEAALPFTRHTAAKYVRVFQNRDRLKADTIFELSKAYAALKDSEPEKNVSDCESSQARKPGFHASPANQIVKSNSESPKSNASIYTSSPVKKAPQVVDETGYPIPSESVKYWERRDEVQELMTSVSRIKSAVEKAKNSDDPLFGRVTNSVIDNLNRAYSQISDAKPYAVCTECAGRPSIQPKGCGMCSGTGLISKYRYDHASRTEIKAMRAKQVAAA